ncbi:MAG: protein-disulfide reductase DsbD domain-containing protein [Planctomycetota bacterium]
MSFIIESRTVSPVMQKCILVVVFLFTVSFLPAQEGILDELAAEDPCSMELFSSVKTYQPGVSFEVGVMITPEDGWHGYWHSPRDGGDAPEAIWGLPEGWQVSGPDFPVPDRMVEQGGLVAIGYKKPFLMRYRIHPAPSADDSAAGKVEIPLEVIWQVCKTTCIYGESRTTLQLAAGEKPLADPKGLEMLARWRDRYPVEASQARGFCYELKWYPAAPTGSAIRSGTWLVRWYRELSDQRPAVPVRWIAYPHGLKEGVILEAKVEPFIREPDGKNRLLRGWQVSFLAEELGSGFQSGMLGATLVPSPGKAKGPVPGMPAIIIRAQQAVQCGPPESGSGTKKGNGR